MYVRNNDQYFIKRKANARTFKNANREVKF